MIESNPRSGKRCTNSRLTTSYGSNISGLLIIEFSYCFSHLTGIQLRTLSIVVWNWHLAIIGTLVHQPSAVFSSHGIHHPYSGTKSVRCKEVDCSFRESNGVGIHLLSDICLLFQYVTICRKKGRKGYDAGITLGDQRVIKMLALYVYFLLKMT